MNTCGLYFIDICTYIDILFNECCAQGKICLNYIVHIYSLSSQGILFCIKIGFLHDSLDFYLQKKLTSRVGKCN